MVEKAATASERAGRTGVSWWIAGAIAVALAWFRRFLFVNQSAGKISGGVASGPMKGDTADETVQGQPIRPVRGGPGPRPAADVDRQPLSRSPATRAREREARLPVVCADSFLQP